MAKCIYPSSFECDCGHQSHFFENPVNEMKAKSRKKRRAIYLLGDAIPDEHKIEFKNGDYVAVICPKLGRRKITGWV